jgi:hypothetical protein
MDPSQLSPRFVIPAGTHVVLLRDIPVIGRIRDAAGEHAVKKQGSVGEVVEAPITNDYAYVVRFTDGEQVRAKKADLAIRRSDAPEAALVSREVDAYEPYLIYRVRLGSHAFGLADEASDVDERGVYLPPATWHWSLQPLPGQIEFKRSGDDVCWWELEKFLRLALKANPNILEALYVPEAHVLQMTDWGQRLRKLRTAFLSKYLYRTYSGYVLSQFRRMQKRQDAGKPYRPKHAMHLIRLLHSGIVALEGRGILVNVGEHREELLHIKTGTVPFEAVHARALELDGRFQEAFTRTALPDRPDVDRVERFLVEARRSAVNDTAAPSSP